MKYKCCKHLLHELIFAQSDIIPCCYAPRKNDKTKFYNFETGKTFEIEEYINNKNRYVEMFKNGHIPKCCDGCFMIEEKDWDDIPDIRRIIISNRTKCSCNCIYCSLVATSPQSKEELNSRETYDILPILDDLRNRNLIKNNCLITIAGGECTEYPNGELEYIIYFALHNNCRIEIFSSGIIYSKSIENALKSSDTTLSISVDCGTEDTYKKIKGVNAFDRVWDNLKNYIKSCENNPEAKIVIKYILIPGLNDNIQEAHAFINMCKSINAKNIELAIEYLWYDKNKTEEPNQNIKDTVNYIKNSGFNISYECQCIDYMNKIK